MIAKPNRILLRCSRPPARPNAADLIQLQPRATAAAARSFLPEVGPTQAFIAPTTCGNLPPMPPCQCEARVLDGLDSASGISAPIICVSSPEAQIGSASCRED